MTFWFIWLYAWLLAYTSLTPCLPHYALKRRLKHRKIPYISTEKAFSIGM